MTDNEGTSSATEPVEDDAVPPGWYPEPGEPNRIRYWDGEQWGERKREPRERPTGRANRLAVTALICAVIPWGIVGGILAMVFGQIALDEIEESNGAERGQGLAKWAIGLGALNVALTIAAVTLIVLALAN